MTQAERKQRIKILQNQKKQLSWHHSGDDSPFGSGTVKEARARINMRIKLLKSEKS